MTIPADIQLIKSNYPNTAGSQLSINYINIFLLILKICHCCADEIILDRLIMAYYLQISFAATLVDNTKTDNRGIIHIK